MVSQNNTTEETKQKIPTKS